MLHLNAYYNVCMGIGADYIAVWAGRDAYLYDLVNAQLQQIPLTEWDFDIGAIYLLATVLIIVCETSIMVFDAASLSEITRYDHDEVFLTWRWDQDRLLLEDFRGERLSFFLNVAERKLKRAD